MRYSSYIRLCICCGELTKKQGEREIKLGLRFKPVQHKLRHYWTVDWIIYSVYRRGNYAMFLSHCEKTLAFVPRLSHGRLFQWDRVLN